MGSDPKADWIARAKRKAQRTTCRYSIAAVGFDRRGNLLGVLVNVPHVNRRGGSFHAEARAIQALRGIHSIVLLRVGKCGDLKPIHPCENCADFARKRGVTIRTLDIPRRDR